MNLITKEIRRAEHECMNIPPPPQPPINALVTPLLLIMVSRTYKMTVEQLLLFFHICCNLRDILFALMCKLHNDTQQVMSHCIVFHK